MVGSQHYHWCGPASVPGQETKILKAVWYGQKNYPKEKKNYSKRERVGNLTKKKKKGNNNKKQKNVHLKYVLSL